MDQQDKQFAKIVDIFSHIAYQEEEFGTSQLRLPFDDPQTELVVRMVLEAERLSRLAREEYPEQYGKDRAYFEE